MGEPELDDDGCVVVVGLIVVVVVLDVVDVMM